MIHVHEITPLTDASNRRGVWKHLHDEAIQYAIPIGNSIGNTIGNAIGNTIGNTIGSKQSNLGGGGGWGKGDDFMYLYHNFSSVNQRRMLWVFVHTNFPTRVFWERRDM